MYPNHGQIEIHMRCLPPFQARRKVSAMGFEPLDPLVAQPARVARLARRLLHKAMLRCLLVRLGDFSRLGSNASRLRSNGFFAPHLRSLEGRRHCMHKSDADALSTESPFNQLGPPFCTPHPSTPKSFFLYS